MPDGDHMRKPETVQHMNRDMMAIGTNETEIDYLHAVTVFAPPA